MRSFLQHNIVGFHYAIRILIGTALVWFITGYLHSATALWAIISVIIVTEPQMRLAWMAFRSRMINTCMGGLVGFCVLALTGATPATLIFSIAFTALLSTCINKVQQGWRLAPITTALVVSAGLAQQSVAGGMEVAFSRTFEVFLGSAAALFVSLLMARVWLPPEPAGDAEKK